MVARKITFFISVALISMMGLQAVAAESKAAAIVDDSMITTKIKAKMLADKAVHSLGISVETKEGIVSLTGNVKTEAEAAAAIELAAATPGVKDVNASGLAVEGSTQPITDAIITAKVKGAFIREKLFGDKLDSVSTVSVETKQGVVYLSGTLKTANEAQNASKLAKAVAGVKRVESSISVKP